MAGRKLQGQVAVVTGASRGIGAAAARRLAQAGASLVLMARGEAEVEAVAAQIRDGGARAIAVPADVSDSEQIEEVIEAAVEQFGRVDILVNNAAVVWPVDEVAEADAEEWAYAIHINLIGPFYMVRNVLPLMQAQGYGRILNLSSGAATTPIAGMSAYCAAKAGLDMFTRTLALELTNTAQAGITVNTLYPGHVDTEMQADIRSVDTDESTLDFSRWHEWHEQGQLDNPAQVAELIYWLVGPWSRDHSGEIFRSSDEAWRERVARDLE